LQRQSGDSHGAHRPESFAARIARQAHQQHRHYGEGRRHAQSNAQADVFAGAG